MLSFTPRKKAYGVRTLTTFTIQKATDFTQLRKFATTLFLILGCLAPLTLFAQNLDSISGDLQALQELYAATDGAGWHDNSGWSSLTAETMGQAYGVTVYADGHEFAGRVKELRLFGNNLTGSLPASIGNLTKLRFLNIKHNSLGGPLPASLGNLASVEYLLLAGAAHNDGGNNPTGIPDPETGTHYYHKVPWSPSNTFTGSIPVELGNLPNVKFLDLARNDFTGSCIPAELGNLTTLVGLYLNFNGFDCQPPAELGNLVNLKNLQIGGGDHTTRTTQPDEDYDINNPGLRGTIPAEWGGMRSLMHIRMPWNHLEGGLPTGWKDLADIKFIGFSRNQLSGPFPSMFTEGADKDIYELVFPDNNFTGPIPEDIGKINVHRFNFSHNELSGQLPEALFKMDRMIQLLLDNNDFTGSIPTDFTGMPILRTFRVDNNNLSGPMPSRFYDGQQAVGEAYTNFQFAGNDFTGEFPAQLPASTNTVSSWFALWVNDLELTGELPEQWLEFPADLRLSIEGNPLTFAELLPNLPRYKVHFTGDFRYTQLKPFGTARTDTLAPGATFTADYSHRSHPDDSYQWTKDGNPIAGATGPTLQLDSVTEADAGVYRLQVTNPNLPELGTLTSQPVTLVVDENGSTTTIPAVPTLESPQNGATDVSTSPLLSWSISSTAETYRVQLSTESSFGSTFQDTAGITSTELQVSSLAEATTYYWRVRASNSSGTSDWSSSSSFTTESSDTTSTDTTSIAAPVQYSPADNSSYAELLPTFEWSSVDGADSYILDVSASDPSEMVIETTVSDTSYTPASELDPERTHQWRVRAVVNGTKGTWSPVREFTTIPDYIYSVTLSGPEGMHMISSPTSNTTFSDLLNPIWTQGVSGSDAEQADPNILVWSKQNQAFEPPSSMNNEMVAGKGYILWIFEDDYPTTNEVDGGFPKVLGTNETENSSPVSVPISAIDGDGSTTIEGEEGWNLIGNPYGVSLSVDEILNAARSVNNQVNSNLYVWDPSADGGGDYITLPEGEGHTIQPFQVFWIRFIDEFDGSLTLDKSVLSVNASKSFKRVANSVKSRKAEPANISFELKQEDGMNDVFTLEFNGKGHVGLDLYDAYELLSLNPMSGMKSSLYSIEGELNERINKSILPDTLLEEVNIPLGYSSTVKGEKTLSWSDLSSIPQSWSLTLKDNNLNKTVDLRTVDSYTFSSTSGRDESRFVLGIIPESNTSSSPAQTPNAIHLYQNYPNPFNPSTEIKYSVDQESEINLTIYNLIGKRVATLVSNRMQEPGTYQVQFNASHLTSGIYIYRLSVGGKTITRKMTLIK